MATQVFRKIEDKRGSILAVTDHAVHRLEFASKIKKKMAEAAEALLAGQDPASLDPYKLLTIPFTEIRRVEVSHGKDAIKVHTVQDGKPVILTFTTQGDDATAIAREIVNRSRFPHAERSENISLFEALIGPVILIPICAAIFAAIYYAAVDLDQGKEIDTVKGGRKGRALKQFAVFLARILGPTGSLAVGGLVVAGLIAWAVSRIVNRPQRFIWGSDLA